MHAFLEHLHRQVAAGHAAQRGGAPQLVVVAAARIQADHQRGLADALGQVVDIGGQVVAAGFLAGLDQHHAARMRSALCLQRHHRGQRTVDRVAIVGATAAVQAVAFHHRFPSALAFVPAGHLRLLVQVAVEQDAVVVATAIRCRHLDEDQRRAAFQAHHFQCHARHVLRARPGLHQRHRLLHVPVLHPVGVEHRRLVGDADVLHQLRDDLGVPFGADEVAGLAGVEVVGGHACRSEASARPPFYSRPISALRGWAVSYRHPGEAPVRRRGGRRSSG